MVLIYGLKFAFNRYVNLQFMVLNLTLKVVLSTYNVMSTVDDMNALKIDTTFEGKFGTLD